MKPGFILVTKAPWHLLTTLCVSQWICWLQTSVEGKKTDKYRPHHGPHAPTHQDRGAEPHSISAGCRASFLPPVLRGTLCRTLSNGDVYGAALCVLLTSDRCILLPGMLWGEEVFAGGPAPASSLASTGLLQTNASFPRE